MFEASDNCSLNPIGIPGLQGKSGDFWGRGVIVSYWWRALTWEVGIMNVAVLRTQLLITLIMKRVHFMINLA